MPGGGEGAVAFGGGVNVCRAQKLGALGEHGMIVDQCQPPLDGQGAQGRVDLSLDPGPDSDVNGQDVPSGTCGIVPKKIAGGRPALDLNSAKRSRMALMLRSKASSGV